MKITYATYSSIGNREKNEDSILACCDGTAGLFLVADGLGGHGAGEYASASVVNTASEMYRMDPAGFRLDAAFQQGQEILLRQQQENYALADMKTTLTALLIREDTAQWAHIGDTRLYAFRKGKLQTRTLDHSVPQMLVTMGEIKESDIRHHEDRNRLLRVMGSPWNERSFTLTQPAKIKKNMQFLLCSDGFWENIVEKEMQDCLLSARSVEDWLSRMAELVTVHGQGTNMDNNTALAVWAEK